MQILRKVRIETDKIQLGDQIEVNLKNYGLFTATAQHIEPYGVWFMFDDIVTSCVINKYPTNSGGFEKSSLHHWLTDEFKNEFPDEFKKRIAGISLPSYGHLFGHDNCYHDNFESDTAEQFQLMTVRKNRIGGKQHLTEWYWIKNATKKELSTVKFGVVSSYGGVSYGAASSENGVRPIFLLIV